MKINSSLSMKIVLVLAVAVLASTARDPCTILQPGSVCFEDGLCHNSTIVSRPTISCMEAYVRISQNLLRPATNPPIVSPIPLHAWLEAAALRHQVDMAQTELVWASSEPPAIIFAEFIHLVQQLSAQFEAEYPNVIADTGLLTDLVTAAERFRTTVLVPSSSSTLRKHYKEVFVHLIPVRSIEAYLKMIIEHISAMGSLPIRKATFANIIVVYHAWYRVYRAINLPFVTTNFEFISSATQFIPAYLADESADWIIQMPVSVLTPSKSWPLFPVVPAVYDEGSFPLSVFTGFEFADAAEDQDKLSLVRDAIIEINAVIAGRFSLSVMPLRLIALVRSTMFLLEHYPGIPRLGLMVEFCDQTRHFLADLFMLLSRNMCRDNERRSIPELLQFFRICGKHSLNLQTRVRDVLPTVIGSFNRSITKLKFPDVQLGDPDWLHVAVQSLIAIPIYQLRNGVRIKYGTFAKNSFKSHILFLHEFVNAVVADAFQATSSGLLQPVSSVKRDTLFALGIATALLVIEGDPKMTLISLLSHRRILNMYFGSHTVKQGFANVINQPAFETLFDDSESIDLLTNIQKLNPAISKNK